MKYEHFTLSGQAAQDFLAKVERQMLVQCNRLPIISGNWCTVAHADLDERMRAMTLHHLDLSLLPLTYTYDADALAFFTPMIT